MPLNIAELQVAGYANFTAIEPCPMIADGEGSVITGRFVTRQVDVIARVKILGADGSIEVLEGTTIHPIWSLDRNDWVPLGELEVNEQLSGQDGPATVLSITILNRPTAVYNIEVHGEHVYQVCDVVLLVHNGTEDCAAFLARWGLGGMPTAEANALKHFLKHGDEVGAKTLEEYTRKAVAAMDARKGAGKRVDGLTEGVRRFDVHGVNRYVDVDTILEKVISYGVRR